MAGNCPKCEKPIAQAQMSAMTVGDRFAGPFVSSFAAVCPHCQTIIGIAAHPEAIADAVACKLKK